jgi:hypothetical protein
VNQVDYMTITDEPWPIRGVPVLISEQKSRGGEHLNGKGPPSVAGQNSVYAFGMGWGCQLAEVERRFAHEGLDLRTRQSNCHIFANAKPVREYEKAEHREFQKYGHTSPLGNTNAGDEALNCHPIFVLPK